MAKTAFVTPRNSYTHTIYPYSNPNSPIKTRQGYWRVKSVKFAVYLCRDWFKPLQSPRQCIVRPSKRGRDALGDRLEAHMGNVFAVEAAADLGQLGELLFPFAWTDGRDHDAVGGELIGERAR